MFGFQTPSSASNDASKTNAPSATPSLFGNAAPSSNPGSLFGKPATTATTSTPLFAFNTPAATAAAASTATPAPLFGLQASTASPFSSNASKTIAPTQNLFGVKPAATTAAPSTLFPAASATLSGGLTLGKPVAAPATNITSATPSLFAAPSSNPGSLFGKPATTTTTTAPFGLSTPATNVPASSTTNAAPFFGAKETSGASPFSSNAPKPTAPASQNTAPALFSAGTAPASNPLGGLFGKPASTTTPATSTTTLFSGTTAPASNPLGGLFGKPATTAPTTTQTISSTPLLGGTTAPASNPLGGLFGKPATTAPTTTQTASSTPVLGGTNAPASNLLGAKPVTTPATTATSTLLPSAPATGGLTLGKPVVPPTSSATTATAAGTPAALESLAGKIKFSDLDQLINKLAIDLQEQDNRFQEQLDQVNKQDMLLYERGQELEETIQEIDSLERDHFTFITHVEMLEEQQNEARRAIEEMEKSLGLPAFNDPQQPGPISNLNVDVRRAAILQLLLETDVAAKQLDNEIEDATQQLQSVRNLKESLEKTNEIQGSSPLEQLQAILNCQMNAITRIESDCDDLSKQMNAIRSKQV